MSLTHCSLSGRHFRVASDTASLMLRTHSRKAARAITTRSKRHTSKWHHVKTAQSQSRAVVNERCIKQPNMDSDATQRLWLVNCFFLMTKLWTSTLLYQGKPQYYWVKRALLPTLYNHSIWRVQLGC